ncbi:probable AMP deaminase isoform X2 [Miscanthus floridulus]|uniref:probable AMP deaminase isoform X2 n=1 Tax=Miscanthus floridulus TaxID=154761 RepID=UPI003458A36F
MVFMQFNLTQFAADILRKEPQQESFIKMLTTPEEIPTADEIEVFKILQKCLELRDSYLFREEVTPWEKEAINDPCTPKPNPNPFTYVREPKSEHVFQMVDGVVHVYADKDWNFLPRRLHRIVIFTMSGRLTLMFIIQHA